MMRSKLIFGITKNLVAEQRQSIPRVEVYQGNSNWKELLKLRVSDQSFSHAPLTPLCASRPPSNNATSARNSRLKL